MIILSCNATFLRVLLLGGLLYRAWRPLHIINRTVCLISSAGYQLMFCNTLSSVLSLQLAQVDYHVARIIQARGMSSLQR